MAHSALPPVLAGGSVSALILASDFSALWLHTVLLFLENPWDQSVRPLHQEEERMDASGWKEDVGESCCLNRQEVLA